MDIETFNNSTEEQNSVKLYSYNNVIIGIVIFMMIYLVIKNRTSKVIAKSVTRTSYMNNLVIICILAGAFYFYNYMDKKGYENYKKKEKTKLPQDVLPRFSNLPEINEKIQLEGNSIEDYLKYFKQFNKPQVKEIKKQLRSFSVTKGNILSAEVNTFLVQELDNLNFIKDKIIELAESLIFSIDIANIKTEHIYDNFNIKLKYLLEKEYNSTKEHSKKKKQANIKNCKADIDIFSGVLVSDQEILPSNY